MANDLVAVGNFLFVPEAEAARLHLQEEGIQAYLSNAELVNMDWFLGNATGYVKILVPDDQAVAAREVLETLRSQKQARARDSSAAIDGSVCLSCGEKLPAEQSTCSACGWSYVAQHEEEDAVSHSATVSDDASLSSQVVPEEDEAAKDEADEDAEEQAETSVTNRRLLIGLFLGGLIALWLLPLLRAAFRRQL